jgi:hypothetical protein
MTVRPDDPDCCQPCGSIRADRPLRAVALPSPLRVVHRHLLSHFATTGAAPTVDDLTEVAAAAGLDPRTALARLAEDDLVAVDEAGGLLAAYPYSPTPTPHVVEVEGVRAYAMCAIDALGTPAMLERDATITSTDPHSGQPILVTVRAGGTTFEPPETVIVYAATGGSGRSVDTCCSTINFFANRATAQAWIDANPGLSATVFTQDSALALGREIFGPLLQEP